MLTFMIDGYLAESRYSWQLRRTTVAAAKLTINDRVLMFDLG